MPQSQKTDALEHVIAGAGSAPVVPLAAAAGVFPTQVHGGTRGSASPFCLPSFSMLRQGLKNGASDAPDAFAAAALAALIDAARGVPRDSGIRYST